MGYIWMLHCLADGKHFLTNIFLNTLIYNLKKGLGIRLAMALSLTDSLAAQVNLVTYLGSGVHGLLGGKLSPPDASSKDSWTTCSFSSAQAFSFSNWMSGLHAAVSRPLPV